MSWFQAALSACDEVSPAPSHAGGAYVALTGNPNSGKTTVFNALTGLRAKVANYAGVTVERKEGRLKGPGIPTPVTILDLPGTYSLSPKSLDEQVSRDVLFHRLPEVPAPSLVVVVADASNLERNLYYVTQVIELGYPVMMALNMMDVARDIGHEVAIDKLAAALGVPVVPMTASTGHGIEELRRKILELTAPGASVPPSPPLFCPLSASLRQEVEGLADLLVQVLPPRRASSTAEALLLLTDERALATSGTYYPPEVPAAVTAARQRLAAGGVDWRSEAIEARFTRLSAICQETVVERESDQPSFSDKLDRVLTHKVWGLMVFFSLMVLLFQGIFRFARLPMEWLTHAVGHLGWWVGAWLPPGALKDLLVNGVISGVGAVVVFLPQILVLFLFISLLEDSGYMARAAFLMDSLMGKVGLHGKSFIPLLSSFACAIPGILATRTIEGWKDRLATLLVIPLITCSARLPVYAVLIAACIPDRRVWGWIHLPGLTLMAMYLLGIGAALVVAWFFKQTFLRDTPPLLIMELPPYKRPALKTTLRHMWDRSWIFLHQAGTIILGINILLWFLTNYPHAEVTAQYAAARQQLLLQSFPGLPTAAAVESKLAELRRPEKPPAPQSQEARVLEAVQQLDGQEAGERLRVSFAGRLGRWLEPVIAPLGFDWKIGIGIIASFAAREVFVSTMAVVYNAEDADHADNATANLARIFQEQKRPDGQPVYTPLTGLTLMVFFVFALQCASTVVVVRRETNSWKWPAFQWLYLGALAWLMAFLTRSIGLWLGAS